jgi:hypothetical protein
MSTGTVRYLSSGLHKSDKTVTIGKRHWQTIYLKKHYTNLIVVLFKPNRKEDLKVKRDIKSFLFGSSINLPDIIKRA